jgi:hypothetical protein
MVRFAGDGCSSSTTLAVGATAELTAEPLYEDSTLPADLEVRSSDSDVITARDGEQNGDIVLTALRPGESLIELLDGDEVYDSLAFDAEPAREVLFTAEDAVFAGGAYQLEIDEVYGACGEECPLIGGGFLEWRAEPADALVLEEDGPSRWAFFSTGDVGEAWLVGREPTSGDDLVEHGISLVDPEGAGELRARYMVQLPDETVLEDQLPPLEVPIGSLVLPQVRADAAGQPRVLLAGADVVWTVTGNDDVLERWSEVEEDPPEGPIFLAVDRGRVTLTADVELLGDAADFTVDVVDSPPFD